MQIYLIKKIEFVRYFLGTTIFERHIYFVIQIDLKIVI